MNRDRQQAIQYLHAHNRGYWWWAEEGGVLVWRDGTTIAFREEIVQILTRLAPGGLPPFGALALLLAGCRGKFPPQPQEAPALNEALDLMRLRLLIELPPELRGPVSARAVLAEAVFESSRPVPHVDALQILRGLNEPLSEEELNEFSGPAAAPTSREILLVAGGLKRLTPESLALRVRTGLDVLPAPAEEPLPPSERARRLIEELSRDRDCGAVARAARDLLAAVRLPRRLAEKEELPLGGVSDITNRGPLDRLLLSELAHDDLTLSVRVALNEALYLRREPPMREPPGTLALLLDSGLRLWGVPRVLATAVALALAAQDRHGTRLLAWRAGRGRLQNVELLTRAGLTEHLAALETEAHPGRSLGEFVKALPAGEAGQSVVITHRDALEDPELRRALSEHAAVGFVATVTREGKFELHAMPLSRRPPVCQSELNLKSILDPKPTAPSRISVDPEWPAIFGVRPFPFLLPIAGKLDYWCQGSEDTKTYGVLHDRRLVEFQDACSGGRVLADDVPGGKTVWMEEISGVLHVVKASAGQRPARLLAYPLPDGPLQVTDLAAAPPFTAVHRCGDVILGISKLLVHAYSLVSGQAVGRRVSPHLHASARFFRGDKHYYAATWDGDSVQFEEVSLPSGCNFDEAIGLCDRHGLEGPWVLFSDGHLVSTANGLRIQVSPANKLAKAIRFSRDGHRVFAVTKNSNGFVYNAATGERQEIRQPRLPIEDSMVAEMLDRRPILPGWNLFRVHEAIAVLDDGLALLGRKGQWRRLSLHEGTLRIVKDPTVVQSMRVKTYFTSPTLRKSPVCSLQRVDWPNGSRVLLDSRGLLHFKSPDPGAPEVTLVLADGEVAGWTSDGYCCGPNFFFDEPIDSQPEAVLEHLLGCTHGL